MNYSAMALIITVAVFMAMMLSQALRPKLLKRINGIVVTFAVISGLMLYGLGYSASAADMGEMLVSSFQAVNSTIWMFAGRDGFSALKSAAPWFAESDTLQLLYWITLLSAVYFTATTVIGKLGQRLLRTIRRILLPIKNNIIVFYDVNDRALKLAEQMYEKKAFTCVFITGESTDSFPEKLDEMNGVLFEQDRIDPEGKWLKLLGMNKNRRKSIRIICAAESDFESSIFAAAVRDSVQNAGIEPHRITMTVLCSDEQRFNFLSDEMENGEYIQADITAYKNLAARMLVKMAAPWKSVKFNEDGLAETGFEAMIIGFGELGQSILCEIVRNSQFPGVEGKYYIIDKDYEKNAGAFCTIYGDMISRYDIQFKALDVFSNEFFSFLKANGRNLRYIAVCTGNDRRNKEAAAQIQFYINRRNTPLSADTVLTCCTKSDVLIYKKSSRSVEIPDVAALIEGTFNERARAVNDIYVKDSAGAAFPGDADKQKDFCAMAWYRTDIYSRESCSASAEFIPAMYYVCGIDFKDENKNELLKNRIQEKPELLNTLSEMEHLRWNAFQSSMGVRKMDEKEFEKRVLAAMINIKEPAALLERLVLETETVTQETADISKEAFGKINAACKYVRKELEEDGFGGMHVCLTDWGSLDGLWEIYRPLSQMLAEAEKNVNILKWKLEGEKGDMPILREPVNFKQLDTNNILELFELKQE